MAKRNGANERSKMRFNPDEIRVGDIITSDVILGIDREVVDELPPPGWLRGDASPFGTDVFDCRSVALTWMSTTTDPDIAETFSQNRESNGREYIGVVPDDPCIEHVFLDIALRGYELKEGPLFKAKKMEDKWDIYHYGKCMYFVRSWTGALVHVALFHVDDDVLTIDSIATSRKQIDNRDGMFFAREVHFLVVNHVLGAEYPHPIPSYRADSEESILGFSFSEFGRRGLYGAVG